MTSSIATHSRTADPAAFNMLDPRVQSDPTEFYAAIHAQGPVHYAAEIDAWVVAGYDALCAVLRDHETFSNEIGDSYFQVQGPEGAALYRSVLRERGWDHVKTLQRTDPPLHARYRGLVDKVFTPSTVRAMVPRMEIIANQLVDRFIDRGECEFVSEFALPFPGLIICDELGLDTQELERFKRWADALLESATVPMTPDLLRATAESEVEMQHYLAALFEKRRRHPEDDLVSRLVYARSDEGEQLSIDELQNVMHQLISGGFDTTTSAIAHGLWLLLRHPGEMTRLRREPGLRRAFIDEALRVESPVQGLMRRATRDVEISGVTIPKGAHVIVRYGAANRDPAKFTCPHKFDIDRNNAGSNLAFGSGAHFCVGRLLAKQELDIAFDVILSRLDDIALAQPLPDHPHHPSLLLRPLRELPIRFSGHEQKAAPAS